ncbi:MAG TPA: SDR family NAD(P)-dependent oxidoreductase [Balneolaceae bacterium]|nr:SDR family NAD(P)-dependent oxidoreductase [Balneolaceae bacterium]
MTNRLKGKLALITGGSSGIGRATAKLFAQSGCKLLLTARREERLDNLKKKLESDHGVEVNYEAFDIREQAECRNFLDSLDDPIDILVNNAGLARGVDAVYEADFDDWDTMIDTNVKGLLTMTRFVTASMKEQNSGHVINIGSTAGHEAYAGGSVYCATKHAVKAITEATKKDLHGTSVRVSMVSPGLVETEFSNVRFDGDDQRADKVYEGIEPLTAMDIAEIVHFTATRPPHVNIMDTIVYPVAQSSATMVARDEE